MWTQPVGLHECAPYHHCNRLHICHSSTSANPPGDRERTSSKNVLGLKLVVELWPKGEILSVLGTQSTENWICVLRDRTPTLP